MSSFVQLWQVRYIVFYPNLPKSILYFYSRILPVAFKAVILLSLSRWRLRFVWFSKRRFLSKNTGLFKSKTENRKNVLTSSIYSSYSVLRWLDFLSRNWLMTSCVLLKERCQFNIGILIFNIFPHPVLQSGPFMWRSRAYSPVVETERYFIVSRIILSLSFQW